ncbi:hypothetical protein EAI_03554 [Harpegnathos saltator]|uniref:Uncharacterized protein n=1 Tax=Harpegnathos saltator TaxID=610380 RepID=E2C955_HARSA|nr:hypothetical protein EAI_03554 [Harpegnathos saltator]
MKNHFTNRILFMSVNFPFLNPQEIAKIRHGLGQHTCALASFEPLMGSGETTRLNKEAKKVSAGRFSSWDLGSKVHIVSGTSRHFRDFRAVEPNSAEPSLYQPLLIVCNLQLCRELLLTPIVDVRFKAQTRRQGSTDTRDSSGRKQGETCDSSCIKLFRSHLNRQVCLEISFEEPASNRLRVFQHLEPPNSTFVSTEMKSPLVIRDPQVSGRNSNSGGGGVESNYERLKYLGSTSADFVSGIRDERTRDWESAKQHSPGQSSLALSPTVTARHVPYTANVPCSIPTVGTKTFVTS